MHRRQRFLSVFATALMLLSLSGCVAFLPDRIHYVWDQPPPKDAAVPAAADAFVGLAFSGGGSRAAMFAAAGAQALHEAGVLEHVTHVSSVSGGSFAAAYLTANPPEGCRGDPVCVRDYFDDYQAAMRQNYFRAMEVGQLLHPNRYLSPTRRITSLQQAIDGKFLAEKTFSDLSGGRAVYINAASYDDGRRFVFSNVPFQPVDPLPSPLSHQTLSAKSFNMAGCLGATPGDFSVALAVASSAAFPPALGPVAIQNNAGCAGTGTEYWHLGDGGILENTGVETLQEVILRRAATGPTPDHAIIFSFDAGKRDTVEKSLASSNLRLWTRDPGRVVSITNMRGDAYRSIVWAQKKNELDLPFSLVTIRYTDHVPARWPESCGRGVRQNTTIEERLNAVPTRLSINACDADLIAASAKLGVKHAMARADVLAWMASHGAAATPPQN